METKKGSSRCQGKNMRKRRVQEAEEERDEAAHRQGEENGVEKFSRAGFIRSREASTPRRFRFFLPDRGRPDVGDIKANANIIKRTLQNFGIHVEMDEITVGPSVTRYALKPAEGVKLSRIVALQNDLGLAFAAHPLRIEAPIPGKSLVGIEVPNTTRSLVGLAGLLSAKEYQSSEKSLIFASGEKYFRKSFYGDLAKLPHMLIAGATVQESRCPYMRLSCRFSICNSPTCSASS